MGESGPGSEYYASSLGFRHKETVDTILAATAFLANHAALYGTTTSDSSDLALLGQRGEPRSPKPARDDDASPLQRALVSGQIEPSPLVEDSDTIALPMKPAGNLVAVIYLDRKGGVPFSSYDLAAAQALSAVAGTLLGLEQTHQAAQELAVQEERTRIAREIHDGVSQNLALLLLKMEIISRLADSDPARMRRELANVMSILEDSVQELRRSIDTLRLPA